MFPKMILRKTIGPFLLRRIHIRLRLQWKRIYFSFVTRNDLGGDHPLFQQVTSSKVDWLAMGYPWLPSFPHPLAHKRHDGPTILRRHGPVCPKIQGKALQTENLEKPVIDRTTRNRRDRATNHDRPSSTGRTGISLNNRVDSTRLPMTSKSPVPPASLPKTAALPSGEIMSVATACFHSKYRRRPSVSGGFSPSRSSVTVFSSEAFKGRRWNGLSIEGWVFGPESVLRGPGTRYRLSPTIISTGIGPFPSDHSWPPFPLNPLWRRSRRTGPTMPHRLGSIDPGALMKKSWLERVKGSFKDPTSKTIREKETARRPVSLNLLPSSGITGHIPATDRVIPSDRPGSVTFHRWDHPLRKPPTNIAEGPVATNAGSDERSFFFRKSGGDVRKEIEHLKASLSAAMKTLEEKGSRSPLMNEGEMMRYFNVPRLADRVYEMIERRISVSRERRGVY